MARKVEEIGMWSAKIDDAFLDMAEGSLPRIRRARSSGPSGVARWFAETLDRAKTWIMQSVSASGRSEKSTLNGSWFPRTCPESHQREVSTRLIELLGCLIALRSAERCDVLTIKQSSRNKSHDAYNCCCRSFQTYLSVRILLCGLGCRTSPVLRIRKSTK